MLQWNRLHAYNAVHVARVLQPLDAQRLRDAVRQCCRQAGLTNLALDRGGRRLEHTDQHNEPALTVLEGGAQPREVVDRQIGREINTPFALSSPMCPVRFFAVCWPAGFELGLTYGHFIADAAPISRLLGLIVRVYLGQARPREAQALQAPVPPLSRTLWPVVWRHGWAWLLSWPGHLACLLRASRPRYADRLDHANGFLSWWLEADQLAGLRQAASQWGVSLNDVFLAGMAKALEPLAMHRIQGRRRMIGLQSIADLRGDLPAHAPEGLGLLLGAFSVFHEPAEGEPLKQAARRLHRQTRCAKRRRLYVRTLLQLRAALPIMAVSSPDRQQKFYRQHYAQWGGLTNLNMDALPQRLGVRDIGAYRRAVSTGPVCPMVWAVTTFRGLLEIGLSYRRTVFDDTTARQCLDRFVQALRHPWTAGPRPL
jgi:NRPS condensation-like uncharacterized protein